MSFIYFLIIINIISFVLCYIDKINSINGNYRIPEYVLLNISLFGGCFGFVIGMYLFHHKTRKIKFKIIYLFCGLWIYLLYKMYY